ncbi:protein GLUTAMINE DUMPER 5 [Cucurbita moschata]|uniref:Protein GLUTAMINE DUMPER 5 n=1 Tax=Cucurbita moschata TaxID=3662 RepID=A0A6J1F9W5_CUCMO|nr:protein GLUTAMINE DUMPER 5 [Cucurbita moschata]
MERISPSAQYSSPSTSPNIAERSLWHSPLPYLFGGLASMMILITFSLVLLACSHWNLCRRNRGSDDLENGGSNEAKIDSEMRSEKANYDDNVLVIMAGNQKPTFLARPVCVRISSAVKTAVEEKKTAENSEKSTKVYDREVSSEANTVIQESGEEEHE